MSTTLHAAIEPDTLAHTLDDLYRRGFTERFQAVGDGLHVIGTGSTLRPSTLVIREYHRFEGVSDPDDMAIVYAIEDEHGLRGTLADAYGVYADPATGAVLDAVPITRARRAVAAP
jgi:hypothetical protein